MAALKAAFALVGVLIFFRGKVLPLLWRLDPLELFLLVCMLAFLASRLLLRVDRLAPDSLDERCLERLERFLLVLALLAPLEVLDDDEVPFAWGFLPGFGQLACSTERFTIFVIACRSLGLTATDAAPSMPWACVVRALLRADRILELSPSNAARPVRPHFHWISSIITLSTALTTLGARSCAPASPAPKSTSSQ